MLNWGIGRRTCHELNALADAGAEVFLAAYRGPMQNHAAAGLG